ncbi:MAG: 16S rRNA (uracil(1498)-N(3))-methyltransferase [Methylobacteriaceae bacterium]|nr:16S rRNA (uracil(1498)-N(3))-methyltransferase [Methylobacteriaceae bacterium]
MARYDFAATRLFVEDALHAGARIAAGADRANFLLNVLRLKEGDRLLVFNGRDGEWLASIAQAKKREAILAIEELTRAQEGGPDIDYCFAPLKHARLDYVVQKAVEMGAARLRPVLTRRTQVARLNLERMRSNVIEAAEQCGVLCAPEVEPEVSLERMVAQWPSERLLVFCDEDAGVANPIEALTAARGAGARAVGLLIGPEGGFDEKERALVLSAPNVLRISLGPRILRADTAAVAGMALIQSVFGDWAGSTT